MYLRNDLELFKDVIRATSVAQNDRDFAVIEKDYYVTMILKQLAANAPDGVFKGGTSLEEFLIITIKLKFSEKPLLPKNLKTKIYTAQSNNQTKTHA